MKYKPKRVFSEYEYGSYLIYGPLSVSGRWGVTENWPSGKVWQTRYKNLKQAITAIDRYEASPVTLEPAIK